MEIEDERAYQIYEISVKWSQENTKKDRKLSEYQTKGLQKGRMWNALRYAKMYKDVQDIKTLQREIETIVMPNYFETKSIASPQNVTVYVEFIRCETWCLEWFCHWTFDTNCTDEEHLASFARFVTRMKKLPENEYCLMGAEDRWRWKGTTDDGKGETPPPCRCASCKKTGVVRINH